VSGAATDDLVHRLSEPAGRQAPADFPTDLEVAGHPGLYSWWGDDHARSLIGEELQVEMPPLLYVGQAGATRWPSGTPSKATLASRVGGNHIRGNARSSTFRLTISTVLLRPLQLAPAPGGRLTPESNALVSAWITAHLQVAIVPYPDRDSLGALEGEVVRLLDPPLNLGHCVVTPARAQLTELRRQLPRRVL
jgi:hypothetical protein